MNWTPDFYAPGLSEGDILSPISASTLGRTTISDLIRLAESEGLTVYDWTKSTCLHETEDRKSLPLYFTTGTPGILVDFERPWPVLRWQIAAGIGAHHQRHIFLNDEFDTAVAWKRAHAWASSFLATYEANWVSRGFPLEDNKPEVARRRLGTRPKYRAANAPKSKRAQRLKCRAIKPNGKPCHGLPQRGTPFCRHHQQNELSTLAAILEEIHQK